MMTEYRPAALSEEQVNELQRTEDQLRSASNQDIILIAYEKDKDGK